MKNRKFMGFVFIAALVFVLAACVYDDGAQLPFDHGLSNLAQRDSILIDANELYALMQQNDPNLVILGLNTGPSTIAGSFIVTLHEDVMMVGGPYSTGTNIPNMRRHLDELEVLFSRAGITSDSVVVVYTNAPVQGARLVWELHVLGVEALFLNGGIAGWVSAGLPTGPAVALSSAPVASDFRAPNYRNDEMNIGISGVLHALQNPNEWVVIDVRAAAEFEGTMGASDNGFYGRIANSVNIEWMNAAVPGTNNHQIRTEAEIREIFAPAFEGRNVILYCRGVQRATHAWMVLTDLGVDAFVFGLLERVGLRRPPRQQPP
jgi:thiosulfate/3-mercaptopyruvate sulfurtransferase